MQPKYLELCKKGILKQKIKDAYKLLEKCMLCPRKCGINRLKNEYGFCKSKLLPKVSSYNLHHGEEPPISGTNGSGTIFFTNCNLKCVFCQNYPISQLETVNEVSLDKLAEMMIYLQKIGSHNINFVTPTHFVPQILASLEIAIKNGLNIPLVYNTNGYDSVKILKILNGIIDIYLPDMKYIDTKMAEKYSSVSNYSEFNLKAIKEIFRQKGDALILDENGIAQNGIIIRHLVLPKNISGTEDVLKIISNLSKNIHISFMSQYFPANKSSLYPEINRKITKQEYKKALNWLQKEGLEKDGYKNYENIINFIGGIFL
ncbi:MAG: radical SAM protein [bacterium]